MGLLIEMATRLARVVNVGRQAGAVQAQQVRYSGAMAIVKNRMKSVKNIAKITKAMQMVAASKLRGAETRVAAARPMVGSLKDFFGGIETAPSTSECIVPLTSDKGLCGGVNTQVLKMTRQELIPVLAERGVDIKIIVVGDKGRSVMRRQQP